MQRADATVERINISRWFTSCSKHRVPSVELDENACLLTRYHHSVSTEKRCSSIYLWRRWRNRLQPLVPSWLAGYLEPASLCSSIDVKNLTQYTLACILHSWKCRGKKETDILLGKTCEDYKQDDDKIVKSGFFIFFSGGEPNHPCVVIATRK